MFTGYNPDSNFNYPWGNRFRSYFRDWQKGKSSPSEIHFKAKQEKLYSLCHQITALNYQIHLAHQVYNLPCLQLLSSKKTNKLAKYHALYESLWAEGIRGKFTCVLANFKIHKI